MCVGNLACGCHVGTRQLGMLQQQSNLMLGQMERQMDQALLGCNISAFAPYKNKYHDDFESFVRDYFVVPNNDRKFSFLPPTKMKITGKEYLVVSGATIIETTTDFEAAKKRAGEAAHSSQGSVYIFRPVLEIAPKRDVVETSITLDK